MAVGVVMLFLKGCEEVSDWSAHLSPCPDNFWRERERESFQHRHPQLHLKDHYNVRSLQTDERSLRGSSMVCITFFASCWPHELLADLGCDVGRSRGGSPNSKRHDNGNVCVQ
jgi:hypothetical protein